MAAKATSTDSQYGGVAHQPPHQHGVVRFADDDVVVVTVTWTPSLERSRRVE